MYLFLNVVGTKVFFCVLEKIMNFEVLLVLHSFKSLNVRYRPSFGGMDKVFLKIVIINLHVSFDWHFVFVPHRGQQ